ncbi:hypothetical protein [Phenylobacterium aquaticum]|uniref:hypothetical protein n=1 Tax=Phenylobacterium aquaticum TaxID=1763816 RepID=UPI001F5DA9AB|nr:hypothetical protein [Phenylobacterium aquaticum]MCI3132066.1 hypothetical protein [Phenylobacterium aquaticum]
MIDFLNRRRRRASSLSWSDTRSAPAVVKVLAGVCVVLALICVALALAYREAKREVGCYAEAAELGLTPPRDCRAR